jgi:hypothetical protein
MINQLREKIYQELITLTNIAEVFDWIPQKLWWFPSIYFSFDRIESSSLSSNHNERIYYFTLNIFQELTTLWNNESEKNTYLTFKLNSNTFLIWQSIPFEK